MKKDIIYQKIHLITLATAEKIPLSVTSWPDSHLDLLMGESLQCRLYGRTSTGQWSLASFESTNASWSGSHLEVEVWDQEFDMKLSLKPADGQIPSVQLVEIKLW